MISYICFVNANDELYFTSPVKDGEGSGSHRKEIPLNSATSNVLQSDTTSDNLKYPWGSRKSNLLQSEIRYGNNTTIVFLKVEQLISPGGALTAVGELCLTFCYEGRIDCKYWQQIQTSTHPSQCNYSSGSCNIHLRIRYIPCNNSNSLNQCQIVIFFGKISTFAKRKAYSDHQCLALM